MSEEQPDDVALGDDDVADHATASVDDSGDDDATGTDATASSSASNVDESTESDAVPESIEDRLQSVFRAIRDRNRNKIGTLTLHAPTRDIALTVDGDAGLRAVAVFVGDVEFHDPLDPRLSSADNGWVGIDFDRLMAVSWSPDDGPQSPGRMTIDPQR
jgi:hypothetical protein